MQTVNCGQIGECPPFTLELADAIDPLPAVENLTLHYEATVVVGTRPEV